MENSNKTRKTSIEQRKVYAENYHVNEHVLDSKNNFTSTLRRSNRIRKSMIRFQDTVVTIEELLTYAEAMNGRERNKWRNAIQKVLNSVILNSSSVEANLPPEREAVWCKREFLRKIKEKCHIAKYKAGLVAKGYVQNQRVGYNEKCAPFVPFSVLLLVLGWFITKVWYVHHAVIFTAFRNGNI